MNTGEADHSLIMRAQQGDQNAFCTLVKRYHAKTLRLIAHLIHDSTMTEDIAQDAFIRAYRALPQFRGEAAFYTWLYRIVVNTTKSHLAYQKRYLAPLIQNTTSHTEIDITEDVATPEVLLQSKQTAQKFNQTVLSLPQELRGAIVLRELEGLSYRAIAAIMACPIGTVRSRISRARRVIAQELGPWFDSPPKNQ